MRDNHAESVYVIDIFKKSTFHTQPSLSIDMVVDDFEICPKKQTPDPVMSFFGLRVFSECLILMLMHYIECAELFRGTFSCGDVHVIGT